MKIIFEEEVKKQKNKDILSFLGKIKGLSTQEIEQLKLITLWESIETFKPEKGCLFTTHLYNRCYYKYLDYMKEKYLPTFDFPDIYEAKKNTNTEELLEGIPKLYKMVLEDRFIYNFTTVELLKKYKVTRKQLKILIEDSIIRLKENIDD